METNDAKRFLMALNEMSDCFSDPLSEERQRLYLKLFDGKCTPDEWAYACVQAMSRETFHKVPLPAQLWDYIQAYRHEQRTHAREAAQLVREAERLALEAAPEWRDAQDRALRDSIDTLETILGPDWREIAKSIPRCAPRYRRMTEEELEYRPQGDPAVAKAKARAFLRALHERGDEDAHA